MNFSSLLFVLGFLPVVVLVDLLLQKKYRNLWLAAASIFFYAWAQPNYLVLLAFVVIVSYGGALTMERAQSRSTRKAILIMTVLVQCAVLFVYKYFNFAAESINQLFGTQVPLLTAVLPIGVSFFTFKSISYVSDVYMGKMPAEKNLLYVLLYIIMFPEIMSGPIDRYANIQKDLVSREIVLDDFVHGIERFCYGLAEKAVLANSLGLLVDSIWEAGPGSHTAAVAWLGSIAYSLQLYFDFAGYSHMAIGIGNMLGLHLAENFDLPYLSQSIGEFWRRWHMTLGSWFREYIYIPLGGNRRHVYRNTAIVFLVTGIWHGASWNFILWGMIHGVFVIVERWFRVRAKKQGKTGAGSPLLSHLYVLLAVNFAWVLFRAPDLPAAYQYLGAMFGHRSGLPSGLSAAWFLNRWNVFVLVTGLLFAAGLPQKLSKKLKENMREETYTTLHHLVCLLLLLAALMRIVMGTYNTFIYFQF
ncbi:MAG: MBOAT family protein [Solobacterium sp.]|nr:MBOAT family protein [Solobacterium sp.]